VRNAYLYVNTGDFIDGSNITADPYLQLLSVTNDTAAAHRDFVQVRLGGNDTTISEGILGHSSHKPSQSSMKHLSKGVKIIIAIVGAILVLGLFACLIWCCCCRKRGKRANVGPAYASSSYQPLHVPAPDAAAEMHAAYNPQYAAPYNPQPYAPQLPYDPPPQGGYQNPYDKR
jgi:hypothetical protein